MTESKKHHHNHNPNPNSNSNPIQIQKSLDESLCPICMDHPHNAVLLLCSSRHNGCLCFLCDTSYRHSNCLDRFKLTYQTPPPQNAPGENYRNTPGGNAPGGNGPGPGGNGPGGNSPGGNGPGGNGPGGNGPGGNGPGGNGPGGNGPGGNGPGGNGPGGNGPGGNGPGGNDGNALGGRGVGLRCPMCRGEVEGWVAVREAREYLDGKVKSCAREACRFLGNYRELRRHARRAHPFTRPGVVDPTRVRTWNRMERRQEYGDILSAIRSAMPGAVIFGDYAIEMGDEPARLPSRSRPREPDPVRGAPGPWWTPFVLFQTARREREEEERVRRRRRMRRFGAGSRADRR